MNSRTYVITHLGIASLARWGFAAGAIVACLPAFACSAVFFSILTAIFHTVESWHDVGLSFLGQRLSFDLVQALQLQSLVDLLQKLSALGVLGILLLWLGIAAAIGLIVALSFILLGLFYNFTGRLELQLAEK